MNRNRFMLFGAKNFSATLFWISLLISNHSSVNAGSDSKVNFTSSNLPIIVIDTNGQEILDEPKTNVHMGIIYNGEGVQNDMTDPFNEYNGIAGIELRGSSSQGFPKKSYAVETRDALGEDLKISLLGMPAESDWVLHGPYSDKSLMRNVITFWLSNRIGRYASRTKFCELVIDGDYLGVYVFMERIKRDKKRVDISKLTPDEISGDDLTGGYIVKVDKTEGTEVDGWWSPFPPPTAPDGGIYYQYHYPKPSDLAPEQRQYIQNVITQFEELMMSEAFPDPENGYAQIIEVDSFVDHFILNEVTKNVDGYRLSAFMYKDRDSINGKLVMGPAWDYNLAIGNADYYNGSVIEELMVTYQLTDQDYFHVPFWWARLLEDSAFVSKVEKRYSELRKDVLHLDTLFQFIDESVILLKEAEVRNFERWQVLGHYVWPNNFIGTTYEQEISYLKNWLRNRIAWLDDNISKIDVVAIEDDIVPEGFQLSSAFPNPFTFESNFTLSLAYSQQVQISLYNTLGQQVRIVFDGNLEAGRRHQFSIKQEGLSSGIYFYRITSSFFEDIKRVVLLR